METIVTKYCGPTDRRGARIRASCVSGSCLIPYRNQLSREANHRRAAKHLHRKLGYVDFFMTATGELPDIRGVFVPLDDDIRNVIEAAIEVVAAWESDALAGHVRQLDMAIDVLKTRDGEEDKPKETANHGQ